jgi:Raf kinase inhibitor-like YbhB/YbcL family protein
MPFSLKSAAFAEGRAIPREHAGEGGDLSPPLHWEGLPRGTKEFALICTDSDNHSGNPHPDPWVHWVLYKIPVEVTKLPKGLHKEEMPAYPLDLTQGRNSWGSLGYGGPLPSTEEAQHRYVFTLYALDQELDLPPGAERKELVARMEGHVVAKATLLGVYARGLAA